MKTDSNTLAFIEPGANHIIDTVNPETGLSWYFAESLEKIRERYPTAEIVNFDAWIDAQAAKQDAPISWNETTEEKYWYMLEVLPPAYQHGNYFLVGEPYDHHAKTGMPRYDAFGKVGDKYVASSRPVTVAEMRKV